MAQSQIDREKLRAAIRRMGSDYFFLMVDAAITVLTEDSLRTLVKGFLNPDELQPDGKEEMSLLENVKAFRKASLQGAHHPEDGFVNRREFGFPLPLYPSYEASDFYLGGFGSH